MQNLPEPAVIPGRSTIGPDDPGAALPRVGGGRRGDRPGPTCRPASGKRDALLWVDVEDPTPGRHRLPDRGVRRPPPGRGGSPPSPTPGPGWPVSPNHLLLSVRDCLVRRRVVSRPGRSTSSSATGGSSASATVPARGGPPMPVEPVVRTVRADPQGRRRDRRGVPALRLPRCDRGPVLRRLRRGGGPDRGNRGRHLLRPRDATPRSPVDAPADQSVTERLYRLRHDLIGFRGS